MKTGFLTTVVLLSGLVLCSSCAAPPSSIVVTGLPNFHCVDDRLYRGAQPDAQGVEALGAMGIKTVINLRMLDDVWPEEISQVKAHGMKYVQISFHGLSGPTREQVAQVLALVENSPPPVFVHCEHGADRTGVIVACYRISHQGWTAKAALEEARRHGMSWVQFGMKKFVKTFASEQRKNRPADAVSTK